MIKQNIVITGGSGFLGSSLKKMLPSKLREEFILLFPSSQEMNLLDEESVKTYFDSLNIPAILTIHCAGITPSKWEEQESGTMFKNILMFEHIHKYSSFVLNFSSGARFNRGANINNPSLSEEVIPKDEYGLSKKIIENIGYENTIHLRAWGIFGPDEKESRMIKRNILRYIKREKIEINKDSKIDYFSVYDLVELLAYLINENKYKDFEDTDLTYGSFTTLSSIARIINGLSTYKVPIEIKESGWNLSYYSEGNWLKNYYDNNTIPCLGLEKSIHKMYKEINERT